MIHKLYMSYWSQLGLQDAYSPVMEEFIYFHDFTNMILLFILTFVGYMMFSMLFNTIVFKGLMQGQMIECIWTTVPGLILIQIALPSLSLLYLMEDSSSAFLTLKAVGHQWYWEYEYSDFWMIEGAAFSFNSYMIPENELELGGFRQLEVDNRVVAPINTKIRMLITSADVLHSWAMPSLGIKADAIPGRINQLNFVSYLPGVVYGQCSELCGAQHSSMPIAMDLIPLEQFNIWTMMMVLKG